MKSIIKLLFFFAALPMAAQIGPVIGVTPVNKGGTGQTNAASGFDALRPALKITYTGTPQTALVLQLVPGIAIVPVAAVAGQATYAAAAGPTISAFAFSESSPPLAGKQLLTLSFDDLAGVTGSFNPTLLAALTSLQSNALVNVGANFSPTVLGALTTFEANALVNIGGAFSPAQLGVLTTLQLNALVSVGSNFGPAQMGSLTTLQANSLVNIGGSLTPGVMNALTVLSLNAVQRIGGTVSPTNMAALTTFSLAGMVAYNNTIAIPSTSMANVASVTLGTIGTLKSIAGASITLSGLKIPSANVNAILALLVSLDGTNGTTLWGTGKTLTINGGTNGAPTGQGITDKATLIARGATITTN